MKISTIAMIGTMTAAATGLVGTAAADTGCDAGSIAMNPTDPLDLAMSELADADSGEVMNIHWSTSTVPAPGAIALLGLAGCIGTSRRRRQ